MKVLKLSVNSFRMLLRPAMRVQSKALSTSALARIQWQCQRLICRSGRRRTSPSPTTGTPLRSSQSCLPWQPIPPWLRGWRFAPLIKGVGCLKPLVLQCFGGSTLLIKGAKVHPLNEGGMGCQGWAAPQTFPWFKALFPEQDPKLLTFLKFPWFCTLWVKVLKVVGLTVWGIESSTQDPWREGTTPILEKLSEIAGANEILSCGFPSTWGISHGASPRTVGSILLN